MAYPNHPANPYYAYYNPQQQLYYPYVYAGHPYMPMPPGFMPPPQPQAPIDPSLLTGTPPQNSTTSNNSQPQVPASPSASYDGTSDEEEDPEQRFTLHPVVQAPSPAAESSSKGDGDDGIGDDGKPKVAAKPQPSPADTLKRKPSNLLPTVTGGPKEDDKGALTAEEIAAFASPVKNLVHIDLDLFPSRAVFENILYTYQSNLSARKRNKALISRAAYAEIQMTLVEIRESRCRRGTAQYRFWVKKMFGLIDFHGNDVVGHQGKPVAIREDIYDILVHCHDQCDHGGRDRTVEVVKDFYRWIPKVIIGEFVKHCPGCSMKRATVKSESSKMPLYNFGDMESMEQMEQDEDELEFEPPRPAEPATPATLPDTAGGDGDGDDE